MASRYHAILASTMLEDPSIDDPARLAEEARAQVEKNAATLQASALDLEVEPPTPFVP